jgi:hypothetical protein
MISDQSKDNSYEEQGDAIAEGSTAEVFIVKRISDGKIFAKKKIRLSDDNTARAAQEEV